MKAYLEDDTNQSVLWKNNFPQNFFDIFLQDYSWHLFLYPHFPVRKCKIRLRYDFHQRRDY